MEFSKEFSCIIGGTVRTVPRESEQEIDCVKFGEDLLYVNAGLLEKYRNEAGTDYGEFRQCIVHLIQRESITSTRLVNYLMHAAEMDHISYPSSFEQRQFFH